MRSGLPLSSLLLRTGGVLTALTVAVVATAPTAAHAVSGDSPAVSTLGALAKITILAPGTTGAVACTGVLVAPRLVLTGEACFTTGTGAAAQPTTARPFKVNFTTGSTTQTINVAGVRYDQARGLALVGLAKVPAGITPVAISSTALATGDTVKVAGYGRTGTEWVPASPHEASFTVAETGSGTATVTGDGSFCPGDSGAPVLRGTELVGLARNAGGKGCIGSTSTSGGGTVAVTTDLSSLFAGDALGRSVLTPSDNGFAAVAAAGFGSVLASGDFDKNGYLDVAVGAPKDAPGGAASGSVTVYYSSAAGLSAGKRLRQTDQGAADEAGDAFGTSLAAGDFNKDGYADLAIGVPTEAVGTVKAGMVMVYLGSATGLGAPAGLTQTNIGGGLANEEGDLFGWALAAGDFNNDTYPDLAIGAPGEQQAGETAHSGTIYVLKGSATGLVWGWYLDQSMFNGANEEGDLFGYSLAAGNVTGSVHTDLVIGAPGEAPADDPKSGGVYIMPGAASGKGTGFGRTQSGNGGANEAGDEFGAAVAVGNLDGDAYADVIVGIPGEAPGEFPKSGTGTVFPGQATEVATGLPFSSAQFNDAYVAGDRFGASLAVGDVDGDGKAEMLVGAPGKANNGAAKSGVAYLYRGQARSTTVTSPFAGAGRIDQPKAFGVDEAGDAFGTGVLLADLTKDGKADAVIGAAGEALPGEAAAGAAPVLTSVFTAAS
ncbi:esterase [Actinoplanes sp. NBRC 101535]|nr:esterase [Actinoplanes sp. NBRC 101535]